MVACRGWQQIEYRRTGIFIDKLSLALIESGAISRFDFNKKYYKYIANNIQMLHRVITQRYNLIMGQFWTVRIRHQNKEGVCISIS